MKNKLKQRLLEGKPALGSWIGFSDPYAVEMMADLGFDWLLIDMEHFPMTKETLRTILMACKGSESVPVVRVPMNSVEYIQAALDLGAQGVMTPMINCLADAQRAVDYARYPPMGRRGFGPIRASRYLTEIERYRDEANREAVLFLQIETPEGAKNARQIMGTKGIDGIFVGNGDLANFMNEGRPGSAEVQAVVDGLIEMARGASLPVGLPVWSEPECNRYVERGAHLFTVGSDMSFMAQAAKRGSGRNAQVIGNREYGGLISQPES